VAVQPAVASQILGPGSRDHAAGVEATLADVVQFDLCWHELAIVGKALAGRDITGSG
jgi:hypothetical protein